MTAGAESYGAGSIWLILLGAALALAASITVEVVRSWLGDRKKRSLFESILRIEISSMVEVMGVIVSGNYPPQIALDKMQAQFQTLNGARLRVERYWDWLMLIKGDELRQDLYDFLRDVEITCLESAFLGDRPLSMYSDTIARIKEKGEGLIELIERR